MNGKVVSCEGSAVGVLMDDGFGTVEPIGGVDEISFIRGAVEKYQGTGNDGELLDYISRAVERANAGEKE